MTGRQGPSCGLHFVFYLLGVGCLLPYFCILTPLQYWRTFYPDTVLVYAVFVHNMALLTMMILLMMFKGSIPERIKVYIPLIANLLCTLAYPIIRILVIDIYARQTVILVLAFIVGLVESLFFPAIVIAASLTDRHLPQAIMLGMSTSGFLSASLWTLSKGFLSLATASGPAAPSVSKRVIFCGEVLLLSDVHLSYAAIAYFFAVAAILFCCMVAWAYFIRRRDKLNNILESGASGSTGLSNKTSNQVKDTSTSTSYYESDSLSESRLRTGLKDNSVSPPLHESSYCSSPTGFDDALDFQAASNDVLQRNRIDASRSNTLSTASRVSSTISKVMVDRKACTLTECISESIISTVTDDAKALLNDIKLSRAIGHVMETGAGEAQVFSAVPMRVLIRRVTLPGLTLFINFLLLFCLFPGVISRIPDACTLNRCALWDTGSWWQTILLGVYWLGNMTGSMVPNARLLRRYIGLKVCLGLALSKAIFAVCLVLMVIPRKSGAPTEASVPFIASNIASSICVLLFSFISEYVNTSVIMQYGDCVTNPLDLPRAGNVITVWYYTGLFMGALGGIVIDFMLSGRSP